VIDVSEFFDDEELTVCAVRVRADGVAEMASVYLDAPDQALLGEQVLSREYQVTYQASAFCGLEKGEILQVGAHRYRVRQAYAIDDGALSRAELTRLDA
jgi:hypothetical protein